MPRSRTRPRRRCRAGTARRAWRRPADRAASTSTASCMPWCAAAGGSAGSPSARPGSRARRTVRPARAAAGRARAASVADDAVVHEWLTKMGAQLDRALLGRGGRSARRREPDRRPAGAAARGAVGAASPAPLPGGQRRPVGGILAANPGDAVARPAAGASGRVGACPRTGHGLPRGRGTQARGRVRRRRGVVRIGRIRTGGARRRDRDGGARPASDRRRGARAHRGAREFRADSPLFSSLRLDDGQLTVYDLERLHRGPRRAGAVELRLRRRGAGRGG